MGASELSPKTKKHINYVPEKTDFNRIEQL